MSTSRELSSNELHDILELTLTTIEKRVYQEVLQLPNAAPFPMTSAYKRLYRDWKEDFQQTLPSLKEKNLPTKANIEMTDLSSAAHACSEYKKSLNADHKQLHDALDLEIKSSLQRQLKLVMEKICESTANELELIVKDLEKELHANEYARSYIDLQITLTQLNNDLEKMQADEKHSEQELSALRKKIDAKSTLASAYSRELIVTNPKIAVALTRIFFPDASDTTPDSRLGPIFSMFYILYSSKYGQDKTQQFIEALCTKLHNKFYFPKHNQNSMNFFNPKVDCKNAPPPCEKTAINKEKRHSIN